MSRILCIWERGDDFGHMSRFLPLALKLRECGHEVRFALRDLSNAETILGRHGFSLLQGPIWLAKVPGIPKIPLNYTELLFQFGFLNQPGLTGLVKGWRELYGLAKPDMILADFGPTALLAARGLPFKRGMIGTGFCSPPRTCPLPNVRPWLTVDAERLADSERKALQTANSVLADFGVKPMNAVADLFDVDEDFLCTFPELDHYPNRGPARYWNPVFSKDQGEERSWPETPGKRIFAYLKPQYDGFGKILGLLRQVKGTVLVFSPGIPKSMVQKYQSPRMMITTQPVKLAGILHGCDLVICHAGHGTVAAALLAGVPLLLLPTRQHLEQTLTAFRVAQMGAGLMVMQKPRNEPPGQNVQEPDYRAPLIRLLGKPSFAQQARAFAAKHSDFDQTAQRNAIVRRIEEILGR